MHPRPGGGMPASSPAAPRRRGGIPEATVARLPIYLRVLTGLADAGLATVSSEALAAAAGVGSAKLRKDLSHLGSYGTRGVGYDAEYLIYQISRALGLTQHYRVAIIGVGNLGHALRRPTPYAGARCGAASRGPALASSGALPPRVPRPRAPTGPGPGGGGGGGLGTDIRPLEDRGGVERGPGTD